MIGTVDREAAVAPRVVHAVWGTLLLAVAASPIVFALTAPRTFSSKTQSPIFGSSGDQLSRLVESQMAFWVTALATLVVVIALPTARVQRGLLALVGLAGAGAAVVISTALNRQPVSVGLLALPLVALAVLMFPPPRYERLEGWVVAALRVHVWGSLLAAFLFRSWATGSAYEESLLGVHSRLGGISNHPNTLGVLAALLLLLEWKRPRPSRLPIAAAGVVLVWAQSKTAWAAMGIILAIELSRFLRRRQTRPSPLPAAVLLTLLFVTGYIGLGLAGPEQTTTKGEDTVETFTGRTAIWEATLEVWQDAPLFGVGLGLWDDTMDRKYQHRVGFTPGHAHNQLIHTLGQSGLVGAGFLLAGFVGLSRLARRADLYTEGVAGGAFVILIVQSFTEVPVRSVPVSGTFLLLLLVVSLLFAAANEVES